MAPVQSSLAKNTNYAEYPLKQPAIDVLNSLPATHNAQLFAKDKGDVNNPGSQIFVVATPKQIYQRSVCSLIDGSPTSYYEWMGPNQKCNGDETVKLVLDLDMEGVPSSRPFNNDIVWVVVFVNRAIRRLFRIDVPTNLWIVLKTSYDPIKRKHSSHLVLHGFKFANVDARKSFLANINLVAEFAKKCTEAVDPLKVVDASVFGKKMFRLYKSSKAYKELPLWAAGIDGFMQPEDSFGFFLKTMATYTEDCQLLELPQQEVTNLATNPLAPIRKAKAPKSKATSSTSITPVPANDNDTLSERGKFFLGLVNLIDAPKWIKYDDWLGIGMNLKTLALPRDEGRFIFETVSKNFEGYQESCVVKRWNGFKSQDDVTKAENILKSWAQKSNPESFKEFMADTVPIIEPGRTYEEVKKVFEQAWFKCLNPPVFVFIDGDEIYFRKKSELKHVAELITFEDVKETKTGNKTVNANNFLDRWLRDPTQRTYKRIDFLPPPLVSPNDTFNTFRGFAADKLPINPIDFTFDFSPIEDLLLDLCDRQNEAKEYLLSWLSHIVQYPAHLPRTGIVMRSDQGRGKNMLFGTLFGEKILGKALYKSSARADNFFGKFANGFLNRLLCNFNEVHQKDIQNLMGAVKETITENVLSYEKKGVDVIEIRNCARQLWFSNEEVPIKLSLDDRRWVAFQASDAMPQTGSPEHRNLFTKIKDWIDDARNVRGFFDYLKARDLSAWNSDDRPRTSFYTDLQQLSLDCVDQWLVDCIENNELPKSIFSKQLASILSTDRKKYTAKGIAGKIKKYKGQGVDMPDDAIEIGSHRARGYRFHSTTLRKTLIDRKIMQPLFIQDDE